MLKSEASRGSKFLSVRSLKTAEPGDQIMAGSAQLETTISRNSTRKSGVIPVGRIAIIATLLAYAALSLFHLGRPDLETDEGRYGISALNILNDYHQIAIVSPDPGGVAWSTWPYVYPAELAGSILAAGEDRVCAARGQRGADVVDRPMYLPASCVAGQRPDRGDSGLWAVSAQPGHHRLRSVGHG